MRFLVDMNLSPLWLDFLRDRGHDAVHWRDLGPQDEADDVIMERARHDGLMVLTGDLDFGITVALTGADGPSVVQLRLPVTLPRFVGDRVADAIEAVETELLAGAVLTIGAGRVRLLTLPFSSAS
jgi:predicted nuclease of predicted toxin-antitoxin system